jgi:DNA (cytosine-5)-methyltransferase 1
MRGVQDELSDGRPARPIRRTAVDSYRGPELHLSPRPGAPDPIDLAEVRRWVGSAAQPTAIDLFCGAGGLSLGLRDAGFTVLVGADQDPWSVETHTANLGGLGYAGDLTDPTDLLDHLRAWHITRVDLIAGGVPCQPFSRAGRSKIRSLVDAQKRSFDDPRAELWRSFVRVVRELAPRAVLLENVPDLAVWDEGAVLLGFLESLRELGYHADARILNAHEHGVPQHRSRLFIVALRDGQRFDWPVPSRVKPTVRDAIGDLPAAPPAQREDRTAYPGPATPLQRRLRRGIPAADRTWVHDHITRAVRSDDAEAFALLPEGGTYEQLPAHLQRYRADIFSDKYNRLRWDGLSRSITAHLAKDGYWYIHPSQHRTLSIREAARIQTFPDRFRFSGSPSHRMRQIGNAVPPLLAEAIGRALRRALARPAPARRALRTGADFRADLLRWHRRNTRSFPWRDRSDPWLVLLAEMCLRRTRADQVRPVYERLIELAPDPGSLVRNADLVITAMRSLGLRWRADNLIAVARDLVAEHGGRVPASYAQLMGLPGVGDYVASAVMTFGFGRRAVLIDTNTERIVSRAKNRDIARRWQLRLDLHQLAGGPGPDAAFNYALLDLGALVCRARRPLCHECPVNQHCAAYRRPAHRTAPRPNAAPQILFE